MRNIIIAILFAAAFSALAAKDEEPKIITGDWEYNSQVQKIADTPLGILFNIQPAKLPFLHYFKCECDTCDANPKIEGGLLQFGFLKNKEINQRYVVVDFIIRASPAFENKATPEMKFTVMRSGKNKVDGNCKDFNGMVTIKSNGVFFLDTSYPDLTNLIKLYKVDSSGITFGPDFEPLYVRIIFDTVTAHETIVYQNRNWSSWANVEKPQGKIEFRNVGLMIALEENKDYRDRYFEISRPTVRQFNTQQEMDAKLEPVQFFPYRYDNLLTGLFAENNNDIRSVIRQAKKHKNPDVLYACARMLLYDKSNICDPQTAIELLKESALKHSHVLAKYELAVCYYRGYGVQKNEDAAFRYVNEAIKFHYSKASALYILMRYDQLKRPIFVSDKLREDFNDKIFRKINSDHDLRVMCERFNLSGPSGSIIEASPKILSTCMPYYNLDDPENNDQYAFFDYCTGLGYAHACYLSAVRHKINKKYQPDKDNMAPVPELLDKGAQHGDTDAIVARMFLRGQNNQLTAADFSTKQLLLLMDYPEFYLLQFFYENPNFPAASEIYAGEFGKAEAILSKVKQPQAKYLLGLMAINRISYLFSCMWIPSDNVNFKRLTDAAADYPAAKYFLAKAYYYNDLPYDPSRTTAESSRLNQTNQLLKQAAGVGFLPAQYMQLTVELDSIKAGFDPYLQRIQQFCDLDYAPAFLLKARALQKSQRVEEAKAAYQIAAQKGNADAFYELAILNQDDPQSWQKYIKADQKRRSMDHLDFYYPQKTYYVWVGVSHGHFWSDELLQQLQNEYKSLINDVNKAYQQGQADKNNNSPKDKDSGKIRALINDKKIPVQPAKKTQRKQQFIDDSL